MTAEKLVSSQSMLIENYQKQPPRPFGTKTLGPLPHEFTPTTPIPARTSVKASSITYPQLTNYRNNYQPKNIQEIIGYMNNQASQDVDIQDFSKERQATNQEGFKQTLNSSGFTNADPFYTYKPTDPSDINLLATASFRFAPPVWKNFRKLYQQPMQQPNTQQVETSNIQETVKNFAKPFVVNLNIFPMEDQYPSALNRYGQRVSPSQRAQDSVPYKSLGDPRGRFLGQRGNKLTIRLNVFPETVTPFLRQEDKIAESSANKIKFV
ncbi:uncharacterized protein LOC108905849 [Anoplophora glabripennis]|uniref:uncharacterized protein LOC108905849 n=1 Tax=Anoplophora glabripennis TaxID=217634 RepID=UPI0008740DA2|nr:uncharacterized protein LOC108905849 [Anoplophora glabripennis]